MRKMLVLLSIFICAGVYGAGKTYLVKEPGDGGKLIGVFYRDHKPVAREFYDDKGIVVKRTGTKITGAVEQLDPNNHGIVLAKFKMEKSLRQGECAEYSPDGKKVIVKCVYKDDKLDGVRQIFDEAHVLLFEEEYKDGTLVSKKTFDKNGKVVKEEKFAEEAKPGENREEKK